ncbi:MAG: Gfo/Idh/MocA family oxidoreductase [Pseudanabaenaceae cyanobacterium bins.68]|nr:Gfo/Idh/MocA family oxidoreductase [Pseudanabaenaceae cyanobacterium bins.68]
MTYFSAPLQVGIIGSGFVAKLRAELFTNDPRSEVVAIAGTPSRTREIVASLSLSAQTYADPRDLIARSDLDLVVIANANCDHGDLAAAVLASGKNAIVEYPLSLAFDQARELVAYAEAHNLLLHIEHIELLSGVHQTVKQHLAEVGEVWHARYVTQNPQRPAPDKWTYRPAQFGFPLVASLSRIHRLTHLFGAVSTVSCQVKYQGADLPHRFTSCICQAQLQFSNGVMAEVGYSKGEGIWQPQRSLVIEGSKGAMVFEGEKGRLVTAEGETALQASAPQGLFKQDTIAVLDFLFEQKPLYTQSSHALYALGVGEAAARAASTNQVISIDFD